jgi:hypothetical protein
VATTEQVLTVLCGLAPDATAAGGAA